MAELPEQEVELLDVGEVRVGPVCFVEARAQLRERGAFDKIGRLRLENRVDADEFLDASLGRLVWPGNRRGKVLANVLVVHGELGANGGDQVGSERGLDAMRGAVHFFTDIAEPMALLCVSRSGSEKKRVPVGVRRCIR